MRSVISLLVWMRERVLPRRTRKWQSWRKLVGYRNRLHLSFQWWRFRKILKRHIVSWAFYRWKKTEAKMFCAWWKRFEHVAQIALGIVHRWMVAMENSGNKVLILQDPDCIAYTLCERGVFSRFEDGYHNCFSPGRGLCFLPYTVVHGREEEGRDSWWNVRKRFVMNTIRTQCSVTGWLQWC